MMRVRLRTNLASFRRGLVEEHRRQVPHALALAVTDMAQRAKADIQASMHATFDQPRAYTLGAVFATRASKAAPRALVGLKDTTNRGTPAWKYLGPEIEGGQRRRKRFERALGVGGYALPGSAAQLDDSGDISRKQIGQILSALGQAPPASAGKTTRKPYKGAKGNKAAYFLAKSKKTGRALAVYQVVGKGEVRPVLHFETRAPTYTARWRLKDVVLESIEQSRVGAFERAWSQALATAK